MRWRTSSRPVKLMFLGPIVKVMSGDNIGDSVTTVHSQIVASDRTRNDK